MSSSHERNAARKGSRKPHGNSASPRFEPRRNNASDDWLWGWHAVAAALANPERGAPLRLLATADRAKEIEARFGRPAALEVVEGSQIAQNLPSGAVHQGVALRSPPLEDVSLDDFVARPGAVLIMLDQVTDPQNVGAVLRSAAAFGAAGVILQDRHAPKLTGVLAKAAVGAVGKIPTARVTNLSRAIESLTEAGWRALGLAGSGERTLDAALANSLLSVGGQSVTGKVAIDGGVTGTLAAPRAQGAAVLSGGSFTDPLNGLRFTGIEGRVTGRGDSVVVERLTATARNGGQVSVTGRVSLAPDFPGNFHVVADKAELVSSPLMTAVSSLDITLAGPLARTPRIGGRVNVVSIDVAVPDRLPATIRPLPGVRHVNTPPALRARLAQRAERKAATRHGRRGGKPAVPFDATLDVTIDLSLIHI